MKLVNDKRLEDVLGECKGWVAVAFTDYGSIPCDHFRPELMALAERAEQHMRFLEINTTENPSLSQMYGVEVIPTLMVFKDGQHEKRYEGGYSRDALIDRFSKLLDKKL